MNRDAYLAELNQYLRVLPAIEQSEAIRYHYDYITDAENEAEAIRSLGAPKKLAASIIADYNHRMGGTVPQQNAAPRFPGGMTGHHPSASPGFGSQTNPNWHKAPAGDVSGDTTPMGGQTAFNSQYPAELPPPVMYSAPKRRWGCLIALLVPVLLLALMYIPTVRFMNHNVMTGTAFISSSPQGLRFDNSNLDRIFTGNHDQVIHTVNVTSLSQDVNIIQTNEVYAFAYGPPDISLTTQFENGILEIVVVESISFGHNRNPQVINVYLPIGHYEDINIRSISGNIFLDGHTLTFGDMIIGATSGTIHLIDISAESISANSISGWVDMNVRNVQDVSLRTTSGAIFYTEHAGTGAMYVELHSISGAILFNTANFRYEYNMTITSISGNLHINGATQARRVGVTGINFTENNSGSSRTLSARTTSGNIGLQFGE